MHVKEQALHVCNLQCVITEHTFNSTTQPKFRSQSGLFALAALRRAVNPMANSQFSSGPTADTYRLGGQPPPARPTGGKGLPNSG